MPINQNGRDLTEAKHWRMPVEKEREERGRKSNDENLEGAADIWRNFKHARARAEWRKLKSGKRI